jgi:signal transduction histidine kinase
MGRIAEDLHDNAGASLGADKRMLNQINATNKEETDILK